MAQISREIASERLRFLAGEVAELQKSAETRFRGLSERELNWKPSVEKWSIAQCFDHLITSDRLYFHTFDAVLHNTYAPTLWQKMPFLPDVIGKLMLKSIARIPTRAFKAPSLFEPLSSNIPADIFPTFLTHQTILRNYVQASSNLDTARIVISSPVSAAAILSLFNSLELLVNHQHRHVWQAEQVLGAVNFGIV